MLAIKKELEDLNDFDFWSGAVSRWEEILELGLEDDVMAMIEDQYPDGLTEIELNDLIWFGFDDFIEDQEKNQKNQKIVDNPLKRL